MLALVLAALVVIATYDGGEPIKNDSGQLFSERFAEDIKKIKIVRLSEKILVFEKRNQKWMLNTGSLEKAVFQLAETNKIELMLGLLKTEVFNQFEYQSEQLAKFDLDQPRVSVFFDDTEIGFGAINPLTRHRYIMVGSKILTVSDFFYVLFIAEAEEYITK